MNQKKITNTLGLTPHKVYNNPEVKPIINNSIASPSKFVTGSTVNSAQNKNSFIQDTQNIRSLKSSAIIHNSYNFNKKNINFQLNIENNTKNILNSFIKNGLRTNIMDTFGKIDSNFIKNNNKSVHQTIKVQDSFTSTTLSSPQRAILLSKPSFFYSEKKVDIQVFYYMPSVNDKNKFIVDITKLDDINSSVTNKNNVTTPSINESTINPTISINSNSIIVKNYNTHININDRAEIIKETSFYGSNSVIAADNVNPMYAAVKYLSKQYNKEVSLIITRIHYPYMDSYILAQYLAHNTKTNSFIKFQESLFQNAAKSLHMSDISIRSHITGIKIQLSGRITTEAVVPRITVKSSIMGSFSVPDKINIGLIGGSKHLREEKVTHKNISITLKEGNTQNMSCPDSNIHTIDYSKFISKNELGSFAIKVWIASNINMPVLV